MKQQLREIATSAGCAGLGITGAEEFSGIADTLRERTSAGLAGRRRFTYKDPSRAANVRVSFPWAKTIVALTWPYLPAAGSPGSAEPGTGRIARFATTDHYNGLRHAAGMVAATLVEAGYHAEVLVDDDRLVDRAAAVRAGVAWWGKSTMALDPKHGPWLLLGSVVTDAALEHDTPMRRDCGTCDACIPACPTGAIIAPGVLDASRCLAHWMQTAGVFPEELRVPLGDRVYGCDDCLDACPPGHKRIEVGSVPVRGRVDLLELLAADDETLLSRYDHFYMPGRRPGILRRNAVLALGNSWRDRGNEPQAAPAVATLHRMLCDGDEVLRLHAAWALGRIGGEAAHRHLGACLHREPVRDVVIEIERALGEETGSTLHPETPNADDKR